MKRPIAFAAALLSLTAIASAQTKTPGTPEANSTTNVEPGTGGRSGAGQPGLPGNKSGPAQKPSSGSTPAGDSGSMTSTPATGAAGSDDAKVQGKAGNKSGPADGAK